MPTPMTPEEFAKQLRECPPVIVKRDPQVVTVDPTQYATLVKSKKDVASRTPYKTTENHDRLQAKFGVLKGVGLLKLLKACQVPHAHISKYSPWSIVLEKPVVCDRYSRANDWRMDAVIESEALHVIVEIKTTIDSMGELLGQCQRYMRHYRPDYLADGEFCPVIVACPVIEPYIVEVLEAQGFYWLANERWDEFFGVPV